MDAHAINLLGIALDGVGVVLLGLYGGVFVQVRGGRMQLESTPGIGLIQRFAGQDKALRAGAWMGRASWVMIVAGFALQFWAAW